MGRGQGSKNTTYDARDVLLGSQQRGTLKGNGDPDSPELTNMQHFLIDKIDDIHEYNYIIPTVFTFDETIQVDYKSKINPGLHQTLCVGSDEPCRCSVIDGKIVSWDSEKTAKKIIEEIKHEATEQKEEIEKLTETSPVGANLRETRQPLKRYPAYAKIRENKAKKQKEQIESKTFDKETYYPPAKTYDPDLLNTIENLKVEDEQTVRDITKIVTKTLGYGTDNFKINIGKGYYGEEYEGVSIVSEKQIKLSEALEKYLRLRTPTSR